MVPLLRCTAHRMLDAKRFSFFVIWSPSSNGNGNSNNSSSTREKYCRWWERAQHVFQQTKMPSKAILLLAWRNDRTRRNDKELKSKAQFVGEYWASKNHTKENWVIYRIGEIYTYINIYIYINSVRSSSGDGAHILWQKSFLYFMLRCMLCILCVVAHTERCVTQCCTQRNRHIVERAVFYGRKQREPPV